MARLPSKILIPRCLNSWKVPILAEGYQTTVFSDHCIRAYHKRTTHKSALQITRKLSRKTDHILRPWSISRRSRSIHYLHTHVLLITLLSHHRATLIYTWHIMIHNVIHDIDTRYDVVTTLHSCQCSISVWLVFVRCTYVKIRNAITQSLLLHNLLHSWCCYYVTLMTLRIRSMYVKIERYIRSNRWSA